MKSSFSFLLLFVLSTATAFSQTTPPPLSKNLIFEGSFAEHHDGTPTGWAQGGFAGGDHGNTSKVTEDRDGNYVSLFIKKTASAHFVMSLKEPISLRPTWTALLCSVDMRVFNYVQGDQNYYKPRIQITFFNDAGQDVGNTGVSLATRFTDAWQTAEREVPIPAGATVAKVWLGTFGATGQLEFRNPYIAPVEPVK